MNAIDLRDRVAIVTGGTGGIGQATVGRFLASGARIIVWDVARNGAANGGNMEKVITKHVDVTDEDAVRAAAAEAFERFGRIDILVNNAGVAGQNTTTWEYPVEEWRRVMTINLDSQFYCCKAVVPGMVAQNYGRIVIIASIAGKEGNPNAPAYSASKAGVIALTKSLAKETAGKDISVNCITPAAAKTAIFDQMTQTHIDFMLSKIPRARFVLVEEVAALAAFCASADCSFTTGAAFDISGGRATY
jgi:3-oxoacyl-[acyl-carrier protein] reductase